MTNMHRILFATMLVFLSGCRPSPNIDSVIAETKTQLQQQLNQDYADKHATVENVSLVQTAAPKYEGSAEIAAYDSTFDVPLNVTSDGKTTLVTIDNQQLESGFQSTLQRKLAVLNGKYSDYILTPAIFELMPKSLQAAKVDFSARLGVIIPIDSDGNYYFGSGCKAHFCTEDETAWVIDKTTGEGAAAIMEYMPERNGMDAYELFHLYGTTLDHLPQPLADWAAQHNMNEANVVLDTPSYQPPPKN